jgi:N-acetylglutamate synthase
MEHARTIERSVVADWPAAETEDLDGWLLRASGGPTHRGNSVCTLLAGDLPLAARIDATEAWYRGRGQPVIIQLGPCARPHGLDAELERRGYRMRGSASALVARTAEVLGKPSAALRVELSAKPSDAWLAISVGSSRFSDNQHSLLQVLERLGSRAFYVLAFEDERPIGACLGVASEATVGVYSMLTLPQHRRRGAGAALLRGLALGARERGLDELYLLVERSNVAACALYEGAGFTHLYDYHYRGRDL